MGAILNRGMVVIEGKKLHWLDEALSRLYATTQIRSLRSYPDQYTDTLCVTQEGVIRSWDGRFCHPVCCILFQQAAYFNMDGNKGSVSTKTGNGRGGGREGGYNTMGTGCIINSDGMTVHPNML